MPKLRFLSAFAALLLGWSILQGAELTTLQGKKITGDLVSIDEKNLTLQTAAGTVVTPLADVLNLNIQEVPRAAPAKFIQVELTDGSLLYCSDFVIKGKSAEVTVLPSQPVKVPLLALSYMLRDAQDAKVRENWQKEFLAKRGNRDLMAVNVSGVLQGLDGTFGEGDETGDKIEFEVASNNRKIKPDQAKISGMIFAKRPDGNVPANPCKVQDMNHNVLMASKLEVNEKGVAITTVAGVVFNYANRQLLARLDYTRGKLTYLSDLDPATVDETSTEDSVFHYRRDRNLDDGPIRLKFKDATRIFPKGLAIHSRTVLTYNIGGDYKDFSAVLGVNELVGGDSRVKVTIEGDGQELFTAEVKRDDEPRPILLNVKGKKMLRITVASELLDLGNHVDLADAKVSK